MINFINKIKDFQKEGKILFYTTKGNPTAYKLMVRHISYADKMGYGDIRNNTFYPNQEIYIADFEKQEILKTDKKIEFEAIKFLI